MSTVRRPATSPWAWTLCGWTLLVWTTRLRNIWGDDRLDTSEQWARTALALSFTLLAVVAVLAVLRKVSWSGLALRVLAGWTVGVWVARSIGIADGDREAAFVAVHLVLAAVSIAVAVLAVREDARAAGITAPALRRTE